MATLQSIPVAQISPWKNYRGTTDPESLTELAESIRLHGLLQPIIVRPVKNKKQPFQLIAGFRRYAAVAIIANGDKSATEILCNVRDLDDDQAFDVQMTENLQRQDISAMDEATAFSAMLNTDRYTIADIAAKVAKSETYVTQRLKLVDLIPELSKDLESGALPVGHAMECARLSTEDQKDIYTNINRFKRGYPTLASLRQDIEDDYIRTLSKAPFNTKDADLVPGAGPCTTCPKRSGANPTLFPDIKKQDRCFDGACFESKRLAWLDKELPRIISERPETTFLRATGRHEDEPRPSVLKQLKEYGIRPLLEDENFRSYKLGTAKPIKGIWINGDDAGKTTTVYERVLQSWEKEKGRSNVKAGEEESAADCTSAIEAIKARQKRAIELDQEKVHAQVKGDLKETTAYTENQGTLHEQEMRALAVFIHEQSGFGHQEEMEKELKIRRNYRDNGLFKALRKLSREQLEAFLWKHTRLVLLDKLCGNGDRPETSNAASAIESIYHAYHPLRLQEFKSAQEVIRVKRNERVRDRIKALREKAAQLSKSKRVSKKKSTRKAAQ